MRDRRIASPKDRFDVPMNREETPAAGIKFLSETKTVARACPQHPFSADRLFKKGTDTEQHFLALFLLILPFGLCVELFHSVPDHSTSSKGSRRSCDSVKAPWTTYTPVISLVRGSSFWPPGSTVVLCLFVTITLLHWFRMASPVFSAAFTVIGILI